jgi:hypothetical protein
MTSQPNADRLTAIEEGALDPKSDLATVLRQCLSLGAAAGSERLREWASRELSGYEPDDALPPYRITNAVLFMDGFTGAGHISRQQVPAALLPDAARDLPNRDIELSEPLATLLQHLEGAQQGGDGVVRIIPPENVALVEFMNTYLAAASSGLGPRQMVERVYWAVPLATFIGVADNVRTILVQLVAEIRAGLPIGADLPSPELADHAVNVAVHGDHNQIVIGRAGPGATAVVEGRAVSSGAKPESRAKTIAWWVFGIVASVGAIAGVVIGIMTLAHH